MAGGFPCTKCGACCRRAGSMPGFPEPVDENGHCVHLQEDNTCGIYEDRPKMCRIDFVARFFPGMTEEEYYEATRRECNKMQRADGQDNQYRIKKEDL